MYLHVGSACSAVPLAHVQKTDALGDDGGAGGVTRDVQRRAAHVEDGVKAENHGVGGGDRAALVDLQADGFHDHEQHDRARSRNSGCADAHQRGGQDDGADLSGSQHGSRGRQHDERDADTLIDGSAVHVDRSSERDGEAVDFLADAHALAGLHGDRNGAVARAADEAGDEGVLRVTPEAQRIQPAQGDQAEVDDHDVNSIAQKDGEHRHAHARQAFETDAAERIGKQGADADRGVLHDRSGHVHHELAHAFAERQDQLAVLGHVLLLALAEIAQADTEENGEEDDREHGIGRDACEPVRRNDVEQRLADVELGHFLAGGAGDRGPLKHDMRLEDGAGGESDTDGERAGQQVEHDDAGSDLAEFHRTDGGRTGDQRGDDDRHDDHFQQSDEQVSERLDPSDALAEYQAQRDAERHTDDDPDQQVGLEIPKKTDRRNSEESGNAGGARS